MFSDNLSNPEQDPAPADDGSSLQNSSFSPAPRVSQGVGQGMSIGQFPEDMTYAKFQTLTEREKRIVLSQNRIINTDTYNRVMDHLNQQRPLDAYKHQETFEIGQTVATAPATFTMQMRRSPHGFLVACGIEDRIDELTSIRITKAELDFAIEHYKQCSVPFFNEGLWRSIVEDNDGVLPIEVYGVRDGTVLLPGEPAFTVTGPHELVAALEPVLHGVFYESLVATSARRIREIVGDPMRFIEVGLRGLDAEKHYTALKAMKVGGGFSLTSNDAGSALYDTIDVGTIGHRYVQSFPGVEEAFRFGIENLDLVVLLVDLVESYQGIDLALQLKDECRDTKKSNGTENKQIWIRLDSGTIEEIKDQALYYLRNAETMGFTDPQRDKCVVEGIDSIEDIAYIDEEIRKEFGQSGVDRVIYGAGGLLVSARTSRSDASTGFKLSEYTNEAGDLLCTSKFSSSPGKSSHPGVPRLVLVNGDRKVAQQGEDFGSATVEEYFEPLFVQGVQAEKSTPEEAFKRASTQYATLAQQVLDAGGEWKDFVASLSPVTEGKLDEVRARYGLAS